MARLSIITLLFAVQPGLAEDRTFSVSVDGQPAGELVLAYQKHTDDTIVVTVRANYRAERPAPFAYEYRGTETWKDGRVVKLDGLGSEDRHKGGVSLVAGKAGYTLRAGVKEVSVRDEVWPTTGAMMPDPDGKPLVVDVMTGDVLRAKVEKVGAGRVTVAGKVVAVTRYRVTAGGNRWDVWYDGANRLTKRVWTRDGRAVVAEVTRLTGD